MQVRTAKQEFTSAYNQFAALARTSNYYDEQLYTQMQITIEPTSITADITLDAWGTSLVKTVALEDIAMSFSGSDSGWSVDVTITPYNIGCDLIWLSALSTWK